MRGNWPFCNFQVYVPLEFIKLLEFPNNPTTCLNRWLSLLSPFHLCIIDLSPIDSILLRVELFPRPWKLLNIFKFVSRNYCLLAFLAQMGRCRCSASGLKLRPHILHSSMFIFSLINPKFYYMVAKFVVFFGTI